MKFDTSFRVNLPPDQAWPLLMDVNKITACMPGAKLLQDLGNDTYKGQVTVKLGPIALIFGGNARITEKDAQSHTAKIVASGADAKGRGNARADVMFKVLPEDDAKTRVDIAVDLNLAGSVAQYGRGAGMIQDVADQLIGEFESRLEAMLQSAGKTPGTASASPAPDALEIDSLIWRTIRRKLLFWLRPFRNSSP
jgi:carbon monoxide dehydrogenase subunit G